MTLAKANLLRAASKVEKVDISAGDHIFSEPTWKGIYTVCSAADYLTIVARVWGSDVDETFHLLRGHNLLILEAVREVGTSFVGNSNPASDSVREALIEQNQIWGLLQ